MRRNVIAETTIEGLGQWWAEIAHPTAYHKTKTPERLRAPGFKFHTEV
ncbi:hypothetical protein ROA7450_01497 [Roseovarius albus]|uniref:Uncharacterized protein n=1 Tax=Roseovarius albus TaxID=1247867 RepID=A0A1X6YVC4_9RHOB|nr:hypothetical protein ROA7450_01497 [Roseovarius albus]